jgi:hypothetical protein
MSTQFTSMVSGVIVGLFVLSAFGFLLDALVGYRGEEPTAAVALLALALGGLAALPSFATPLRQEPRPAPVGWIAAGLAVSIVVAAVIIRGDIRSWLLVALVVVASVLTGNSRRRRFFGTLRACIRTPFNR